MLQQHHLGSISVCALWGETLMSKVSIQAFSEGTAIITKNMLRGKKKTFIKPPHTQEQQESLAETTPHEIIYSN